MTIKTGSATAKKSNLQQKKQSVLFFGYHIITFSMEQYNHVESLIIRDLIFDEDLCDPMSEDFHFKAFSEKIEAKFQLLSNEGLKITLESLQQFVPFFKEINDMQRDLLTKIGSTVKEMTLSNMEIVEMVLKLTNANFFTITKNTRELSDSKSRFHIGRGQVITDGLGEEIDATGAMDTSNDSANIALRFIQRYNVNHGRSVQKLDKSEKLDKCHRLIVLCNIWYVLDDLMDSFKYDFQTLSVTENVANFFPYPERYSVLIKAGNERFRNNVMEGFFMFGDKMAHKIPNPVLKTDKSVLRIKSTTEQIPNFRAATSLGSLINYFFHLHLVKLPGLNNITINDIFTVVSDLQFALSRLAIAEEGTDGPREVLANIPVKIKKDELISFLEKSTKLSRKSISACIQEIGPHLSPSVYLWDTPMIAFGEFYYFSLPSLVASHMVCLMQKIVDKALSKKQQLGYFNTFVQQDIDHDKIPYKFRRIANETINELIPSTSPKILVYEMETKIVAINTFLYKFPLSRYEYYLALEAAAEAANELNEYLTQLRPVIKELTGKEPTEIISIVLTNYPIISGFLIADSHVMDQVLLMNYLSKGKYERGQAVFVDGKLNTSGTVSYKYYINEKEFNDRFSLFCSSPDPIEEVYWKYTFKETELLKKIFDYRIVVKGVDEADDLSISYQFIKRLEYLVKQFFYFEKALSKEENKSNREFVESRFQFLMPQTFSVVASERKDRFLRLELIRIFESAGMVGIDNLIFLENALINKVSLKPVKKAVEHPSVTVDDEQVKNDLEQLVMKLKESGYSSMAEKVVKLDMPKVQLDRIVDVLISVLGNFKPRYCAPEELENQWFYTFILAIATAGNKSYDDYVAASFLNFIDLLNYNFLYQKARDVSEEILEFSFKNRETPIIGWLCLQKCYTKQSNILEALVYTNLVLSVLDFYPQIEHYLFFDCFYQSMLLYREMRDLDSQIFVFEKLHTLDLGEYEEQKIYLSHYNGFLSKPEEFEKISEEIIKLLTKREDKIISYGQSGVLPWIAFILNVLNLIKLELISPDNFWENILNRFKDAVDGKTYEALYIQFIGGDKNKSKTLLKEILSRLFETRSYRDLANEVHNVKLIVNKMAINAINDNDFEVLFLFGFISNDQTLIFKEIQAPKKTSLIAIEPSIYLERINDYPLFVRINLHLKAGQLLLWIFSIHDEVFGVSMKPDGIYKISKLEEWDIRKMSRWISELGEFYFPDKGEYSINDQENKYINVLDSLSLFKLPLEKDFKELLLYTDLKIGQFPFNLFTFRFEDSSANIQLHEYKVLNTINKKGLDFISYHSPITNVISLEWLIDNGTDQHLKKGELTVEAWSPIEDKDLILQITCEKLKPLLKEKYGCEIVTDRVPAKPLSGMINIFLAHGGKDLEGFKTIYTKESEGYAIVKDEGIRRIIGTGEIALVFVCNSAYISKQLFSERLISFTQHVLSLGYKAVVAPAWSLSPDIVTPWTEAFINAMQAGQPVSFAVHSANIKISKAGHSDHNGFYDPTGWACMHLYGNPNIAFI